MLMLKAFYIAAVFFVTQILMALSEVQSDPEKIAQSVMLRHFATVCCRITRFSPNCSEIN